MDLQQVARDYIENGFVSGVDILSEADARHHRSLLEQAEASFGPLHYKAKVHTIMQSPLALATHPRVLDVVEALIGPNILLYDVEYIIKEPHTPSFVSWHQDLTYWGLSDDAQVSLWLALSPATAESGCMRMIPGSHKSGKVDHVATEDDGNVLLQGQTVEGVSEDQAVMCPLKPGQASFHHGWTLHASMPNESTDRRIGLNAQFIAPMCVRPSMTRTARSSCAVKTPISTSHPTALQRTTSKPRRSHTGHPATAARRYPGIKLTIGCIDGGWK